MKSKQIDDAVERFRQRRYNRLKARFDADENEGNSNNGGGGRKSGGHGNTRIPFGLCQREGITIQPGWSPSDAWEALEGKGYSAGSVYSELRKTGKVSGGKSASKAKVKRPPTPIKESAFPQEMLGKAFKKNTMTVADYVSQHCDDGDITDFLSSATGAGSVLPPNFTCKKDTDGDGCALRTGRYVSTHEVENVQLTVPMISAMKDEGGKAAAIRSFVHEWTHFLDNCASEWENGKSFSGQHQKLSEALEKEKDISISDEARKLLDDFNTQYDNGQKAYQEERKGLWKKVVDDMFQGKKPDWLNSDGSFDYSSSFFGHYSEVQEYKKRLVKYEKACDKDWRRTKRSFGDGLCTLQGLYDSLYEGRCREQGIVKFGHSTGYFKKEKENRAMELIADYVALKATNPKLAKVFANDKPVIAAALDECIVDMTRKMAGGNKR